MILYDITMAERQQIAEQVRVTSPWSARIDAVQAELVKLDERVTAALNELEQLDILIKGVSLESDLVQVAEAKIRRPLLAERLGQLRVAAEPLRQKVADYSWRRELEIGGRIDNRRRELRHAAEAY